MSDFGLFLHFLGQFWKKEGHMISRIINIKHIYILYVRAQTMLLQTCMYILQMRKGHLKVKFGAILEKLPVSHEWCEIPQGYLSNILRPIFKKFCLSKNDGYFEFSHFSHFSNARVSKKYAMPTFGQFFKNGSHFQFSNFCQKWQNTKLLLSP